MDVLCDRCGRLLAAGAPKYAIRVSITADFDGHLAEQAGGGGQGGDALEQALRDASQQSEEELLASVHDERAFLVCPACRRAIAADPLSAGSLRAPGGVVQ